MLLSVVPTKPTTCEGHTTLPRARLSHESCTRTDLSDMAGTSAADADPVGHGGVDGDVDSGRPPHFLRKVLRRVLDALLQKLPGLVVEEVRDLSAVAGSSSCAADAAEPREAVGDDDDACALRALVTRHPDLFEKEILERLDPTDRAFLGEVDRGCRAAVVASDLPCAGTRVGMRQLNPADRDRLARDVRAFTPYTEQPLFRFNIARRYISPLELFGGVGYVESSDLPRAGGVVRLELGAFSTSAERLAWAKEKGCRWDARTCAITARGGHLEALRWAREQGCEWDELTCRCAADGGHLEVLKWAREHDCPWGSATCHGAFESGHLEVIKWAREHDCPYWPSDDMPCQLAARGGHLEVLRWAREHDCPWTESTCSAAADGGHLEVLKWAREQDCPWCTWTCMLAAQGGHLEVLRWAREHHCPWEPQACRFRAEGNPDMLALIQQLGG